MTFDPFPLRHAATGVSDDIVTQAGAFKRRLLRRLRRRTIAACL